MLLDVNSGAVIELDMEASRYVDNSIGGEPIGRLTGVGAEFSSLVSEGILSGIPGPQKDFVLRDVSVRPDAALKAVCLHVAHVCNLACEYCFIEPGLDDRDSVLMSPDTGRRAVDFLIESSAGIRNLEIDFFGGEPLLNLETVFAVTSYAELKARENGKNVHLTLTTNCVDLSPELVTYFHKHDISLILSLDGRPEVHDRYRRSASGGSYDTVSRAVSSFLESGLPIDYYVRGTYTRHNLDFVEDVLHMLNLGIRRLSLEPVVGGKGTDWGIRESDLPRISNEYARLVRLYRDRIASDDPFEFFHFNLGALQGQCAERRMLGCGAGYQYVAVAPDGSIFPCHQFIRDQEFRIGSLDEGIVHPEIGERMRANTIMAKDACRDCWARFLCSGGCHAAAFHTNGSTALPDALACEVTRVRLEAALAASSMTCERMDSTLRVGEVS